MMMEPELDSGGVREARGKSSAWTMAALAGGTRDHADEVQS